MAFAFAPAAAEAAPAIAEGASASGAAGAGAAGSKTLKTPKPKEVKTPETPSPGQPTQPGHKKPAKKSHEAPDLPERSKKSSKSNKLPAFVGKIGNKKLLLPELIGCLVVLIFGTLVAPKDSKDDVHRMIVKGSALMGVFFILAILSTGGKGTQKAANMIGLLITVAYLLNSSDIHNVVNWINSFFKKPEQLAKGNTGV
jgi:hypothetical protein